MDRCRCSLRNPRRRPASPPPTCSRSSSREPRRTRRLGRRSPRDRRGLEASAMTSETTKTTKTPTNQGRRRRVPARFFERTTCVTGEVTFGGDLARRTSSDSLRFALQSEDSHVEAPAPGACKVTVSLAKAGHVIVGLRVHLGNSGSTQTPTEMIIGPAPIPAPIPAPAPAPPPESRRRDRRNRRTRRRRRRRTGGVSSPSKSARDAGTTCH